MQMAGIDVAIYKSHSVRAASTSKAWEHGVPIEEILRTAGWSSAATFATYYKYQRTKPMQRKFLLSKAKVHVAT